MIALTVPSPGRLTRGYSALHRAQDYGHGAGYTFHAAAAGRVTAVETVFGYGLRITLGHGDGFETRYAHSALAYVATGLDVTARQDIGHQGASGLYARGVHLHFELLHNGTRIDPSPYFRTAPTAPAADVVDELHPEEDDMKLIYAKGRGFALVGFQNAFSYPDSVGLTMAESMERHDLTPVQWDTEIQQANARGRTLDKLTADAVAARLKA